MKKKKVWFAGGNTQTNQNQYPNINLLLRWNAVYSNEYGMKMV